MSLCLLCLINCSEDPFSVDDENYHVDNEMQLCNVPDGLLSCKKSIKLQNVFNTGKGAMLPNDNVVKLTIDNVAPRSLE